MRLLWALLCYAADRHVALIAVLFGLFTLFIVHCGNAGSAEVHQRARAAAATDATASATSITATSAFSPPASATLATARGVSVALTSLTEAAVAVLRGDADPLPLSIGEGWTAEVCAAWGQRWQRHFALAKVNLIRLRGLSATSAAVAREGLSCLRPLCVGCHVIIVPELATEAEGARRADAPQPLSAHRFCSTGDAAAAMDEGEDDVDVLLMDTLGIHKPTKIEETVPTVPTRCGTVAVITPTVISSLEKDMSCSGVTDGDGRGAQGGTPSDGTQLESVLAYFASRVEPPLPELVCTSTGPYPLPPRAEVADQLHESMVRDLASRVAHNFGYRPRFVVAVAWCSAARTLVYEASPAAAAKGGVQPVLYILCVHDNEVLELLPSLQSFARFGFDDV